MGKFTYEKSEIGARANFWEKSV